MSSDRLRYPELLIQELELTMRTTEADMDAIVERTCTKIDNWYANILRTVPEEILNTPFREAWGNTLPATPQCSMASESLTSCAESAVSAILAASNYLGEEPPNTEEMPHAEDAATAEAKKVGEARSKPSRVHEKPRMRTTLTKRDAGGRLPVVRPKLDIREKPANARKPRPGETLVSLRGSPVVCEGPDVPEGIQEDSEGKVQASEVHDPEVEKLSEGEDPKKQ